MIEHLIGELERELGIKETLHPVAPGVYSLPLEENANVKITALPLGFTLEAEVGPCPQMNREVFVTRLLLANLFGQGTRQAVLGLNETGNVLTLSKVVDYNVDYKDFSENLDDFINTMDFWRDEVRKHR